MERKKNVQNEYFNNNIKYLSFMIMFDVIFKNYF